MKSDTVCRLCSACCPVTADVEDGKLLGAERKSFLPCEKRLQCPKLQAAPEIVYARDRVLKPLIKKKGASGADFQEASWDEALGLVAEKFAYFKQTHGPESVAWLRGMAADWGAQWDYANRLMNLFGSPNTIGNGSVCHVARDMAHVYTYGAMTLPLPKTARCIVIWGKNDRKTAPGACEAIFHAKQQGAKLIVIDPVMTPFAKMADIWLQIKPGHDGQLAMAMIHEIIENELYDADFVQDHCIGFEELKSAASAYPADSVGLRLWLDPDAIRKAARLYATTKPACIIDGNGIDMQLQVFQITRAVCMLRALTKPVLVTGSTGYVGGRLVPKLLESGYRVRALGRSTAKLKARPWANHPLVELAAGDVLDYESLLKAAAGCRAAFYLVHSMGADPKGFSETDRTAAQYMARAAAEAGLEHIIYLGGLGNTEDPLLSKHLRSRHEVAEILQSGPVPATFLRAAMILGSGSASFEILRYLVDRLPIMVTPRWVYNPVQPIAIRNVLNYLQGCLEHEETRGQTFDIGGPEVVTYRQLFDIYAEEAHLRHRLIIPVPVLTPTLSSYWIHLITPVPSGIAKPLAEGLRNPVICKDNRIRAIIPQELLDCRQTIRLALERVQQQQIDTCWMDAGGAVTPEWTYCGDTSYAGGTVLECSYSVQIQATPEEVWQPIIRMGGETGYYFGNYLWRLRGWIDRLLGGIGFRGGRRHPLELRVGDALDFWRVLEVEPPHRLLLLAEMKLPGEAVLEFHLTPQGDGKVELRQTARFLPRGLGGMAYWYSLVPFHHWVYRGMLKAIAAAVGRPIIKGPEPCNASSRRHGKK